MACISPASCFPATDLPGPLLGLRFELEAFLFVDLAGAAHEFDKRLNLSLAASPANL